MKFQEILTSQHNFLGKKKKVGEPRLSDFKTYSNATVIKTV